MRTSSHAAWLAGTASGAILAAGPLPGATVANAQTTLPVPSSYNWSGLYFGLHGGGVWSDQDDGDFGTCGPFTNLRDRVGMDIADSADDVGCPITPLGEGPNSGLSFPTFELDEDYVAWTGGNPGGATASAIGGAHFGSNFQVGRLVFGFESDLSVGAGDGLPRNVTFDYFDSRDPFFLGGDLFDYFGSGTVVRNTTLEWLSTIRGRVGAALGPDGRFLIYGTSGLAVAGVDDRISGSFLASGDPLCSACSFSGPVNGDDTRLGAVFGAGGEIGITNNLSIGLQYLYLYFGEGDDLAVTFTGNEARQFDVELGGGLEDLQLFSLRVNWRFGGP